MQDLGANSLPPSPLTQLSFVMWHPQTRRRRVEDRFFAPFAVLLLLVTLLLQYLYLVLPPIQLLSPACVLKKPLISPWPVDTATLAPPLRPSLPLLGSMGKPALNLHGWHVGMPLPTCILCFAL